jgi:hypothetical protein
LRSFHAACRIRRPRTPDERISPKVILSSWFRTARSKRGQAGHAIARAWALPRVRCKRQSHFPDSRRQQAISVARIRDIRKRHPRSAAARSIARLVSGGTFVDVRLMMSAASCSRDGCDPFEGSPGGLIARTMRRAFTFVLYRVLIIGGSWAIYGWLVLGTRLALFAAFLALFSASLLWADLLSGGR